MSCCARLIDPVAYLMSTSLCLLPGFHKTSQVYSCEPGVYYWGHCQTSTCILLLRLGNSSWINVRLIELLFSRAELSMACRYEVFPRRVIIKAKMPCRYFISHLNVPSQYIFMTCYMEYIMQKRPHHLKFGLAIKPEMRQARHFRLWNTSGIHISEYFEKEICIYGIGNTYILGDSYTDG